MSPSLDALHKNGKYRTLQAIELESGVGRQWRLWKWASYCASEVNSTHAVEYASSVFFNSAVLIEHLLCFILYVCCFSTCTLN